VPAAEREALARQIRDRLLDLVDEKTGTKVVRRAWTREEVYHGDQVEHAPDVLVGYERTFGGSDDTALGELPRNHVPLLEDNASRWSGNHLMDPEVVPGVLLTNLPVTKDDPSLCDVTATMLQFFGVPVPAEFAGRPLQ
jgi:predicted AlkP superfamily phosphohydrolase/phosphomutase